MIWNWEEQGWNGLISDLTSVVSVTAINDRILFLLSETNNTGGYFWNIETNTLSLTSNRLNHRVGSSVVVWNNKIYLLGGCTHVKYYRTISNSCYCYDVETDKWITLPSMAEPRDDSAAVYYQDQIFVFGGYHTQYLDTCERYDIKNQTWTWIRSMPVQRIKSKAIILGENKIGVLGGFSSFRCSEDTVLLYDVIQNTWELATWRLPVKMNVSDGLDAFFIPQYHQLLVCNNNDTWIRFHDDDHWKQT